MSKHHRHGKVRAPSAPYVNWEQMQSGTTRDREWTRGILADHASHAPAAEREPRMFHPEGIAIPHEENLQRQMEHDRRWPYQRENTFQNRAESVVDAMRDLGLGLGVPAQWFKQRSKGE